MSLEQIRSSLRAIQPVNGSLFPTVLLDQNDVNIENPRDRSIWIVDEGDAYRVEYSAVDWVGSLLREYIVDRLSQDGFKIDPQTLTIKCEEQNNGSTTIEESIDHCCGDRIDRGDCGEHSCE